MEKAVIFGAGQLGKRIYENIRGRYDVIAFLDNFEERQGTMCKKVKVFSPTCLKDLQFDHIFIGSMTGHDEMIEQILGCGVDAEKINDEYALGTRIFKHNVLSDFSKIVYERGIAGNVAELGVFQGEYAKRINSSFPDRMLYLFDTFTGFDERDRNDKTDIVADSENGSLFEVCDYLKVTTVDLVLGKMKHPQKCIVKKGYFPDTTVGIEEQFVFVSIDVDLYKPTLEGLRFFWSRMVKNGIIIVDDYYDYEGVKKAVQDFINETDRGIRLLPVGDGSNIILCK